MKTTSTESYQGIIFFSQQHKERIKEALQHGDFCAPELEKITGLERIAISRRTSELEREKEIIPVGTKKIYSPRTKKHLKYTVYSIKKIQNIEVSFDIVS